MAQSYQNDNDTVYELDIYRVLPDFSGWGIYISEFDCAPCLLVKGGFENFVDAFRVALSLEYDMDNPS